MYKILLILIILENIFSKYSVNCLNASEIDSYVLLHNSVKNTLIEIAINGRCESPKPTVIYVNETQEKLYLPRATILYRCSDLFACCPNPRHSCLAMNEEEVDIGFYTLTKTEDQTTERSIEVLKFTNHTKCGCRRKESPIPKQPKDILLVLESKEQEIHRNSTLNETKTTSEVSRSSIKTTVNPVFIEKHLKNENQTKTSIEGKTTKNYDTSKMSTTFSTTAQPLRTESKIIPKLSSKTTVPIIKTTQLSTIPTKRSWSPRSPTKWNSPSTYKLITKEFTRTDHTLRPTSVKPIKTTKPILTTKRSTFQTKTKEKEKNLISNITLIEINNKTAERVLTTTPLSTTQVISRVPLIRSSINYDELEREEDLKPEEDVIYNNNGNGFDLFFTNGIFFRPLTTTPYRSHRAVERVTPRCG